MLGFLGVIFGKLGGSSVAGGVEQPASGSVPTYHIYGF